MFNSGLQDLSSAFPKHLACSRVLLSPAGCTVQGAEAAGRGMPQVSTVLWRLTLSHGSEYLMNRSKRLAFFPQICGVFVDKKIARIPSPISCCKGLWKQKEAVALPAGRYAVGWMMMKSRIKELPECTIPVSLLHSYRKHYPQYRKEDPNSWFRCWAGREDLNYLFPTEFIAAKITPLYP